jgi:hypothetical protein
MNSGEMIHQAVNIIREITEGTETRQLSLREVKSKLNETFRDAQDVDTIADGAIAFALDNWMVDKVLDYDDSDEKSAGELVWFIRSLPREEADHLSRLSKEKQAMLKILRESESESRLGAIRASDALLELRRLGFDLDSAPSIPSRTSSFFRPENDKSIEFKYLLSEYEKSEEYEAVLGDLDEKERWKQERLEMMDE